MNKESINITVGELKTVLDLLPENMEVVIPIIDEENVNNIRGFRLVRTAGTLSCLGEKDVLCINTALSADDNIVNQVRESHGIDLSIRCTGLYL